MKEVLLFVGGMAVGAGIGILICKGLKKATTDLPPIGPGGGKTILLDNDTKKPIGRVSTIE